MKFLVTAGNTREMIDRVRDWGNIFTGNTGRSIAEALAARGSVELLTSNAEHARQIATGPLAERIDVSLFKSHSELKSLLAAKMQSKPAYDAVFMTAAVADYSPAGAYSVLERKTLGDGREAWIVQDVSAGKVKSHFESVAFRGVKTEKLVDLFRSAWHFQGVLVKFKLEVGIDEEKLIEVAQASRTASGANFIVANTLEMVAGENAGAWLLGETVRERIPRAMLAARLAELIQQ